MNSEIGSIKTEQREFQEKWDFKNYLDGHGEDFYKIFCSYRREDVYKNDNYISDGLTTSECLAKAKELIETAEKDAKKACVLQRTVSTSLNNLFALPEFEPLYDKFALYNYIRIRTEDEILKLRLIGIDFSGDSVEKIDVTFSEQIESVDGRLSDLQSIIQQAKSMAASYPSTALQAKQGAEANSEIADIYDNGLNAEKTIFANNDNNEVTITQSGIICKRMDNEGFYDGKQLRITGNVMAFTDDDWKSVKMAIGERIFKDSNTLEEEVGYGIIADNIIGKLIASDKCIIGNEDNNVIITGDGITIKNGLIQSANYEAGKAGSMLDLTNGTFDYAGGNLTYKDNELTVEGKVIADELTATNKGKIANFNISENKLFTDDATFNNNKGIYFGEDGLRIGDSFKVGEDGDISISGDIYLKNGLWMWCKDTYGNDGGSGYRQCFFIEQQSDADQLATDLYTNFHNSVYVEGTLNINELLHASDASITDLTINGDLIAHGSYNNVGTSVPNLMIGGAHKIRMTSGSSKRFKTEIKPIDADDLNPDKLYDIDIVQYKFKKDYLSEDDQRYDKDVIGFIAEDIYEKYPIAADYTIDNNGNTIVNDWNFRYMVPAMLKLIQNQKKEIDSIKQENRDFKQRLENLEKKFV